MPQSLFEISEDMQALDDLLFLMGGDVTDEAAAKAVEEWIKELSEKLHEKADGYAALITTMEKRAQVRKEEADRLYRRADIDSQAATFLRQKLKMVMEQRGVSKVETQRYRISIAGNGGKAPLNIYDESIIPEKFLVPQPPKVDRDVLRGAIEAGEDIPGAKIEPRGTSLRIK